MHITTWLRNLDLERYTTAFQENDIDAEVLAELTADDLMAMGISSVGHRRKLLAAIATLRDSRPITDSKPAAVAPEPVTAPITAEAERRQLTVMFCDIVGSTGLAAQLDPEDLRDIMHAYNRCVAQVVRRYEGHVAKYMGDGVLAYFGYPRAHEDEAERAVRAGLEVVAALRSLRPSDIAFQVRVGIATGLVVVGDLIGEGAAREETVVGETPNLAARLQALAGPGDVVIAQRTCQLLGGLFDLADLGTLELKGFTEPVAAWRVLGPSRAEGRFEAQHTAALTPLVGRDHEFGLLLDRFQRAKDGEGQVVLLSGEAGIGKSRLMRALREQLASEPHTAVSHYCSPYYRNTALYPVITLLERAAGLSRDEPPEQQLDKLEALLALAVEDVSAIAPFFADLLAIPAGERYPSLSLTPQQKKERTLEALLDQLAGLAQRQPVVALYEDVHWVDPSTLELLELVIERIRHLPVLVVITFRPDFTPAWTGYAHVTSLSLSRLGRRQGAAMIERLTGGKALPEPVLDQIIAKTDGVPLFVEELTKTVLEAGLLKEVGNQYILTGPLPPLAIPATLQDSLMARLDRLAPVKEVAQIGAAIGREFSYELLAAVSLLRGNELQDALSRLAEAELVFCRGAPPKATYVFKHALVQDAAYQSLLRSKRQQLHGRIAQALEERFAEHTEARPELVAHHCTLAGFADKAVGYWQQAGQQAIQRSAMAEAVAHLTAALELLAGLPDSPEHQRKELDLQVTLGGALHTAKGWASPEMGAAYARACEIARQLGGAPQQFPALYGLVAFHTNRAELDAALGVAEELYHLAEGQDDAIKFLGHRVMANVLMYRGAFGAALPHIEQVVGHYDPQKHGFPIYVPIDSRVNCRSFLAWIRLFQGYPDTALLESRQALAEARDLGHPHTLAFALHVNCLFHQVRGDWAIVQERAAALIRLAAEQGFPHLVATGTLFHGWAISAGGSVEAGLEEMRRGLAMKDATGSQLKVPYYFGLLASLHAAIDQQTEARSLLSDAITRVEQTQERWFKAELCRLWGEGLLLWPNSDPAGAEPALREAMMIAQEQGAKLWQLRAANSLAQLYQDQGRDPEARDLLGPIYSSFTEGSDTSDLKQAAALLGLLA
ncbi:adenylate/guanylate cyclase domain-containing protein [Microvirga sp. 0TCS3.31]